MPKEARWPIRDGHTSSLAQHPILYTLTSQMGRRLLAMMKFSSTVLTEPLVSQLHCSLTPPSQVPAAPHAHVELTSASTNAATRTHHSKIRFLSEHPSAKLCPNWLRYLWSISTHAFHNVSRFGMAVRR